MARPRKRGIDYFSFDTDFFSDLKIKLLYARYGADGIALYIYLLCEVYREGYYLKWCDDTSYIIGFDLNMKPEKVQQIMKFLLERSLFNNTLFQSDTIITSTGIQKRYQEAVEARGRKEPVIIKKYWLLSEEETKPWLKVIQFSVSPEKNTNNSRELPEKNTGKSREKVHKVKESKVKESKVKDGTNAEAETDPLSLVVSLYTQEIDPVPSTYVLSVLDALHKKGMEPEVMIYAITSAADNNKRNWAYVRAILQNLDKDGIMTMNAVNDRERKFQASKNQKTQRGFVRDNRGNFTFEGDYERDVNLVIERPNEFQLIDGTTVRLDDVPMDEKVKELETFIEDERERARRKNDEQLFPKRKQFDRKGGQS